MWRSDDASRCVCSSTVGDDVASCDELAGTTDVGGGYRRLTNRECLGLEWGNLPTGWIFVFWGRFGSLFGCNIRGEIEITSPFYQKVYVARVEKRA